MRHTKSHTGKRRSHHGLEEPRLSKCDNCNEMHRRHRVCGHCGFYRGRQIVDVKAIEAKKTKKRKEKAKEMEESGMRSKKRYPTADDRESSPKERPMEEKKGKRLNLQDLSKKV